MEANNTHELQVSKEQIHSDLKGKYTVFHINYGNQSIQFMDEVSANKLYAALMELIIES